MRALIRVLLPALMLGVGSGVMAQGVSVTPGQNVAVDLSAESFTTSYFIDVGPQAQQMVISLESPQGTDVDLMLRFGNAFPSGPPGLPPLFEEQLEYAHYVSVSTGPSERIAISRANRIPVQAGRWHLLLINFSGQPVTATLRADVLNEPVGAPTIEMVYNDPSCPTGSSDYWFDPGPRQNSNSNPGQTIGEQRRIAMDRAAELLANELRSAV
ncbi:MAG TPA: hypothetical protein PKZ76_18620, partial [Xanthomonadaceae bacterium]|nr:hypothetical protein [Xanthomonadaceae bacterium]